MTDFRHSPGRLLEVWANVRRLREMITPAIARVDHQSKQRSVTPFSHSRMQMSPRSQAFVSRLGAMTGGISGLSFFAFVAAPALIFLFYASLWQTEGYVAEARLTVRAGQEKREASGEASSIIGKLTGGNTKSSIQDAYIILNYIKSPSIIFDLGGRDYIEKYYSIGKVDYFSRLKSDPKIEDLVQYWSRRVTASVDTVSSILTVKVEAFQPEDARRIAQDVITLSENLINTISVRSRTDALDRSEREVTLAADQLSIARENLAHFRDLNSVIDPGARAKSVGEIIGKLTLDKIGIENSFHTLQGSLGLDSPTLRVQRSKLDAINKQIDTLKRTLTDAHDDTAVSSQLTSYERLKLDQQFKERMYTIAQNSYERARQELERQQLFLAVIVPPTAPQKPSYPAVFSGTLSLAVVLFIFWAIISLVIASITDQMA